MFWRFAKRSGDGFAVDVGVGFGHIQRGHGAAFVPDDGVVVGLLRVACFM